MARKPSDDDWARVKDLFHDALEREAAERAAFLKASCGDETGVRAEVERLLAAHDEAGGFIEQSPVAIAGRVISHYKIERPIGAGGMGEVYLARDLELGRTVAIKIALGDADAQARLKREAQHASQLNHPNICTIHEVGEFEGQPFIVMEFVEGLRLSDVIPAGGLPPDEVKHYGIQTADALAHAHRHGVVHRDLKTANIVVTSEDRVKVLDFGLARRLSGQHLKDLSESQQLITAEGMMAGTLSCMAPELLRGATADARSDIWALGVLLYEMATGKRPFTGETGFELSAAILHDPLAPFPESVSGSLRTIIARCLEKNPQARYQTADDVRLSIENGSEASRSIVEPSRPAIEHRSFLLRCWQHRIAWTIAVVLAIGSYLLLRRDHAPVAVGASGRPAIAVMSFENMGGQDTAWLTKGVPNMLLTGLAQADGLDIVSTERLHEAVAQSGLPSLDRLEKGQAAQVARRAGAGAIVVGSIAKSGNAIRIDAQVEDLTSGRILAAQSVQGGDVFALVDQLSVRIRDGVGLSGDPGARPVADVSTSSLDAFRLFSLGTEASEHYRADEARRALEEAVRIDPAFAEAYLQLVFVAGSTGQPGQRRAYLQKAAAHTERLSERRQLLLTVEMARDAGNFSEASRALDELIARFPDTEPAYMIAMRLYRDELRDVDRLVPIMKRGISALPNSTSVRNAYGYALIEAGQYADAIQEFEKYVDLAPREGNAYDSLADGHLMSGSPDKAVEFYSRAITVDPTFNGARDGWAWTLAVQGRYEEALAVRPPRSSVEAFILSRVGRYREAAKVLEDGRQRAARDETEEWSVSTLVASLIAIEQKEYGRALRELSTVDKVLPDPRDTWQRGRPLLVQFVSAMAELGAGRKDVARAHLQRLRQIYNSRSAEETLWYRTLQGEFALANGELDNAAAAFAAGEPHVRIPMQWGVGSLSIAANSLLYRDGLARTAKARGDVRRAIQLYRELLTYGPQSKFVAVFEPRYLLELARLLEKTGDKTGALKEYQRFLELWKNADADLPELAEARRAVARLRVAG
jgi:eukaryotic-like serine/threonine-protein kinase